MAFLGSASIALIFLIGFFFWRWFFDQNHIENRISIIEQQLDSLEKISFPDYYKATKLYKQFTITSDLRSYVNSQGQPVGVSDVNIQLNGKIGTGYLLVEAFVDGNKPLTKYDSIYVNLHDNGGHLLRNKSLPTPASASGANILLYNLNSIQFLKNVPYDETLTGLSKNWRNILNDDASHNIYSFLSSRVGGKIVNIVLAYSCETSTPNCEIEKIFK